MDPVNMHNANRMGGAVEQESGKRSPSAPLEGIDLPKLVSFEIPASIWDRMRDDVAQKAPDEACGLIAGKTGQHVYQALTVYPVANVLSSSVRYQIDPEEQLSVFDQIDQQGWDLAGIYHSHPRGPDDPSPTDINEAYYPEAIYVIWSGRTGEWKCRGFIIRDSQVRKVRLTRLEDSACAFL